MKTYITYKYTYEKVPSISTLGTILLTWARLILVRSKIRTVLYSGYLILKCLTNPVWVSLCSRIRLISGAILKFNDSDWPNRWAETKRFGRSDEARCEFFPRLTPPKIAFLRNFLDLRGPINTIFSNYE